MGEVGQTYEDRYEERGLVSSGVREEIITGGESSDEPLRRELNRRVSWRSPNMLCLMS